MNGLRFLLVRARPHWRQLAVLGMLAASQSVAALAIPWFGGRVLGAIASGEGFPAGSVVAILLAAMAFTAGFSALAAICSAHTAAAILAGLRREVYDHIVSLPVGFHDNHRQGELLSLATYEVSSLSSFLSGTLATAPAMVLTAAGAVVGLFLLNPALAVAIPVLIPAFVVATRLAGRRVRHMAHEQRIAEVGVVVEAETQLGIIHAIKAFAVEDRQAERYRERLASALRRARELAIVTSTIGPAIGFAAGCVAVAVLAIAGNRVATGGMTPSDLFRFLLYAALLTRPVTALGAAYGAFQVTRGALRDLERVLGIAPETGLATEAAEHPPRGPIMFSDVVFAYPGRDRLLDGVSFTVGDGETVALTGPNGAGKSTLISLLLRFYTLQHGQISIGGVPIENIPLRTWRRNIGFVPQRPLLFNGTVRDNVVFGDPDASEDAIARAMVLAQADKFVADLPDGLDTTIGDHGVLLSGGQRQRIALARALLSNPPILVFDEATSMVDLEGEAAFIAACRNALVGRTVIIVTHRPASLALADRILEVDGGAVWEIPHAPTGQAASTNPFD